MASVHTSCYVSEGLLGNETVKWKRMLFMRLISIPLAFILGAHMDAMNLVQALILPLVLLPIIDMVSDEEIMSTMKLSSCM